jgi:hypothetical protein
MLTKEQVAEYLGRPLTSSEDTNFDSYLDIANHRLSNLVCFSFDTTAGERTYDSRPGYRTLFIDPCTAVTSVTIEGNALTTFVKKQNDSYQGSWFNSLEFDDKLQGERVVVTATWGLGTPFPADLGQLLAGLFGIHESELKAARQGNVKEKRIEDTWIKYGDSTIFDGLVAQHVSTVQKYAQCQRAIAHGLARPVYPY